ncbi:MAG: aminotransferase class V-fold PLP-dependent enzyme [Solirubrobacterales bacterium]|nr:aminotransferase class V-fold PLP-dependent enzyme [Solirubrobacterales bacterium]
MLDVRDEFGGLAERAWLNCAHQGPLPDRAVTAAQQALEEKRSPWRIADDSFAAVPSRLKAAIGHLIGANPDDVVLANSASYGLELLSRTLPLAEGDEILLVDGDFPATIYPWLPLRERGIRVRFLPGDEALTPERLADELGPATRVLCASWVFSFTGRAVDITALGEVCRRHEMTFVVNGSQAVGARALDVAAAGIDALVSSGFKWTCGPYATGFTWLSPRVRDSLTYRPAYWLTHQLAAADGLERAPRYELAELPGASAYDVFCSANFINFRAWTASIELLLEHGIERVAAHDQALVARLVDGLGDGPLRLLSPPVEPERSTLVFVTHPEPSANERLHASLREAGVEVALRAGRLRLSPHLYNTADDIDRALAVLRAP